MELIHNCAYSTARLLLILLQSAENEAFACKTALVCEQAQLHDCSYVDVFIIITFSPGECCDCFTNVLLLLLNHTKP